MNNDVLPYFAPHLRQSEPPPRYKPWSTQLPGADIYTYQLDNYLEDYSANVFCGIVARASHSLELHSLHHVRLVMQVRRVHFVGYGNLVCKFTII